MSQIIFEYHTIQLVTQSGLFNIKETMHVNEYQGVRLIVTLLEVGSHKHRPLKLDM